MNRQNQGWKKVKLGEVAPFKYGKALLKQDRASGNIPIYGSNGIIAYNNKCFIEGPGIIIGRKGTVGTVNISQKPFWPIDTTFYVEDNPKENNLRFIYYLLKTCAFDNSDSAVPGLNRDNAHSKIVNIPPLQEQREIADILGSLDDKIEANRRQNKTLEAIAQALFKSWFVDFEPVKAKSEGRRPEGLAPEIANLFPSSFVDSPLGKIPEGWEVKALDKIIQINPTTSVDRMRPVTFVDMKALPISGFSIMNFEKKIYSNGAKFRNGDILIARITPCLENGKTGMVDFLDDNESGFGSTEFIVLRGASSIQTPYIACLSRNNEFRAHCIKHMNGSSGRQRVSTSCFSDFYMPIPTKNSLLDLFHKVCVPIFKKITYNARTTQSLIELRDILLPPLTCGTIHPLFMES